VVQVEPVDLERQLHIQLLRQLHIQLLSAPAAQAMQVARVLQVQMAQILYLDHLRQPEVEAAGEAHRLELLVKQADLVVDPEELAQEQVILLRPPQVKVIMVAQELVVEVEVEQVLLVVMVVLEQVVLEQ
jgi:hypothetical protein